MKQLTKILLIILLAFIGVRGQSSFGKLAVLMDDGHKYNKETRDYIERVQADGGEVISPDSVYAITEIARTNGTLDSLHFWWHSYAGIKKDANNKVTKLYSINGTTDAAQTDTSKAWTYTTGYCQSDSADFYKIVKTISATDFSMSALIAFNFIKGTATDQTFIALDNNETAPLMLFYGASNGGENKLRLVNLPASGTMTGLLLSSAKHYLGFRITESVSEILYLNGTASSTYTPNALSTDITNIRLGANMYNEKYLRRAKIYEIKIFNRNLSDAKWTLESLYFNQRY